MTDAWDEVAAERNNNVLVAKDSLDLVIKLAEKIKGMNPDSPEYYTYYSGLAYNLVDISESICKHLAVAREMNRLIQKNKT